MQNGLAIIKKTDNGTKGFHLDQETIEFARLNALTKKRIERAAAERRMEIQNRRKAEKAEARRKAYTVKAVGQIVAHIAACYAVVWGGQAEMIHPTIAVPVSLFFLCAACVRFGVWLVKESK